MTYEKYKTGTFRVCVFLTILLEVLAFFGRTHNDFQTGTRLLGVYFDGIENVVFGIPVFIWSTYFFSLWIYKGFIDKQ